MGSPRNMLNKYAIYAYTHGVGCEKNSAASQEQGRLLLQRWPDLICSTVYVVYTGYLINIVIMFKVTFNIKMKAIKVDCGGNVIDDM